MTKEFFGWGSLVLTAISYTPYLVSIWRGRTRPHVFTWLIWFVNMSVAYLGQDAGGAGPGAWATGLTALLNVAVIVLSLKHGERNITRFDWVCFVLAMTAIPVWQTMHDPLYAVLIALFVDLTGFAPTVRKSFYKPQEENISPYLIGTPKHILAILAIHSYNVTTLCFPLMIAVANMVLVTLIVWRRRVLAKKPAFDAAPGRG